MGNCKIKMTPNEVKWHARFLLLAEHVAVWSKDPSTQCGAIIVRPDRTVVSLGYNGFPRGIADTDKRLQDKDFKHAVILHSEDNAILDSDGGCRGCTIYVWPIIPCPRCAAKIIQAHIAKVVAPMSKRETVCNGLSLDLSRKLFKESGTLLIEI